MRSNLQTFKTTQLKFITENCQDFIEKEKQLNIKCNFIIDI